MADFHQFEVLLATIRAAIDSQLQGSRHVNVGYLEAIVQEYSERISVIEDSLKERLIKHLETIYFTRQADGSTLKRNFQPWLSQLKQSGEIDFYYWGRLERWWRERSVLPLDPIRSVDRVSDEILGFLGNPKDTQPWSRRGLVMGHVQMGKTTNYSALISKAADVGYQYIIVLSGLTKFLRYQTQTRLDKAFVGRSSITDAVHMRAYPVAIMSADVGSSRQIVRHPICLTTQLQDFNTSTAQSIGANEQSFNEPLLFVTKKTPKVLEKIRDWLKGLNANETLSGAMLLIDDEADNASVNTRSGAADITRINLLIREILSIAHRSSYVGYTATPFANIFIHPDSADAMIGDDLFPKDFIKYLDPPSNYDGTKKLFSEGSELNELWIKEIPRADYLSFLPLSHKQTDTVGDLPSTLIRAVYQYVIFRAIRIADGLGSKNSAMLVNVSRFNSIQKEVELKLFILRKDTEEAIRAWAKSPDWQSSEIVGQIFQIWEDEYKDESQAPYSWDTIRANLLASITPIEPRLINMNHKAFDYEKAPEGGLHVIAIGGYSLSRGLTLEGLAISYVLRNVAAQDTLLQMARWFGYHDGYDRLCRVFLPLSLISDFYNITEVIDELSLDFERMEKLGLTPNEFGLKVRHSTTAIAITAANKMRTAREVSFAQDFSLKHVQGHSLFNDSTKNESNYSLFESFIATLQRDFPHNFKISSEAYTWSEVPATIVLSLIKTVKLPQIEFSGLEADGLGLLSTYIKERSNLELAKWDIAIPKRKVQDRNEGSLNISLDSIPRFSCRTRTGAFLDDKSEVIKINEKNAIAFGAEELRLGQDPNAFEATYRALEKAYEDQGINKSKTQLTIESRSRPLLLLHFLKIVPRQGEVNLDIAIDKPTVSAGIVLTKSTMECNERKYQASVRLQGMIEELRSSEIDDEVIDDDE